MSPVPIFTYGEPPVLAKSLSKVQSWDPDIPHSQGRKRHRFGIHGSVVAAEIGFPLLKWLLHTPDLCSACDRRHSLQCPCEGPFRQGLGAVGSGSGGCLWDAELQHRIQIRPKTAWEGSLVQPRPALPLAHLLCNLTHATQVFCASVSWAQ